MTTSEKSDLEGSAAPVDVGVPSGVEDRHHDISSAAVETA